MHLHLHLHLDVHQHLMYIHRHGYVYIHMCIYIDVCIYVYIYMHIEVYMYIDTYKSGEFTGILTLCIVLWGRDGGLRWNRLVSAQARMSSYPQPATLCQMERPILASILEVPGCAEGVGAFVEGSMGWQGWVLSTSTTCRELRGSFMLWRLALVAMALRDDYSEQASSASTRS